MNVPVLRPIVIRDDPTLRTRPRAGHAITAYPDSRRWFVVSGASALMIIVLAFAAVLPNNVFQTHGATASQSSAHTIAFTQPKNGLIQIFTMDSDGQGLRQITAEDANTTQVSWSADGKRLVFVNDIDGHEQIYRIDATGTRETRLTNDNMRDVMPSWSPNSYAIAYVGIDGANSSIWIVNSDGTGPRKATDPSTTGPNIDGPLDWSPDGHLIAFASGTSDQSNIMLLRPKDGRVTQLTHLPGQATSPSWSPDGNSLVFSVSTTDGSVSQSLLYTIHADGTDLTQITSGDIQDTHPVWSPDGAQIAFVRMTGQQFGLFVANPDGTNPQQISIAPAGQMFSSPIWSPESREILFVLHAIQNPQSGNGVLKIVNANGGNLRTLSATLAPDSSPVLSPPQ